jgi:hypothetical protein
MADQDLTLDDHKILVYYDGAQIIGAQQADGGTLLAVADQERDGWHWPMVGGVVPAETMDQFKAGTIGYNDAMALATRYVQFDYGAVPVVFLPATAEEALSMVTGEFKWSWMDG